MPRMGVPMGWPGQAVIGIAMHVARIQLTAGSVGDLQAVNGSGVIAQVRDVVGITSSYQSMPWQGTPQLLVS